jgi:hypothetical protein
LGVSTDDFSLAETASDELSASADPYLRWFRCLDRLLPSSTMGDRDVPEHGG